MSLCQYRQPSERNTAPQLDAINSSEILRNETFYIYKVFLKFYSGNIQTNLTPLINYSCSDKFKFDPIKLCT